ncbi:MAG: TPR end-of-group domain-containing protein [Pseudomonadota bacterium]
MNGYGIGSIDEIAGGDTWAPLRRHFGVEAFGVNAWVAKAAGDEVIGEHDEARSGHEELYVVVSGGATFGVDGTEHDAPAGSVLFVKDPSVKRKIVAREAGTTVLSIGAKPGEAYAKLPWEDDYDAILLFQREDYEGARQRLLEAIERRPGYAGHVYNLACAEARLGERDAALEHLREACATEERFVRAAQTDEDLASIRDDPRFPKQDDPT